MPSYDSDDDGDDIWAALGGNPFTKFKGDVLSLASLVSLGIGTTSGYELLAGALGMLLAYGGSGDPLDGAVAALSGIQIAKGRYQTVALPTLAETYKIFEDYQDGKKFSKTSGIVLGLFLGGYFLAVNRYV